MAVWMAEYKNASLDSWKWSCMKIYVVQPGDTVDTIAEKNQVNVQSLIYDNQLEYPYPLAVGQALLLQDGMQSRTRFIKSNGYAYPYISTNTLEQTLPFLSELSVFSYGFTSDGRLVYPNVDDSWMITQAWANDTLPILTLTPLGPDGNFNSALITSVVQNPENRAALIKNLLDVMEQKGYYGVDIDFEYIAASDRDAFSEFVRVCADAVHTKGWQLSVALAPKTSATQKGTLYEGKDYAALGAAADHVLLMTYEWGYTYGPPMAVAPINQVRRVVEYALTEIPREKINLGIPNYGYDWALPFRQGISKARNISNLGAVQIAIDYGVPIQFDETAKSPFFTYTTMEGVEHEVWFEDVRSYQAKFDLIKEKGLRGAGYWQIMRLFRANWLLLDSQFYISKGN